MAVDGKIFFCFWHKKHVLTSFSVFCDHPRIQCGVLPVSLNCNNHYTTYKNYKVGILSKIGVLGPQGKLWRGYFSYDSNRLTGGHIDPPGTDLTNRDWGGACPKISKLLEGQPPQPEIYWGGKLNFKKFHYIQCLGAKKIFAAPTAPRKFNVFH